MFGCMPVYEIYSRRKRRAERGEPDVYEYDHVPYLLRMQVRYILDSALGPYVADPRKKNNNTDWREIHKILLKEKGLPYLFKEKVNPKDDCLGAITSASTDLDDWLDVVEFCFFCIDCMRKWP